MFTLYRIVKWSIAETDSVQCEQEQEQEQEQVLGCVAGIASFDNGAKWSCSRAEIASKVAFLL